MLRTKVHIPPLRSNLVIRSRLIEQLDQAVQPGVKLTLVSAPAGYGKTTFVLQWARACRSSVGWLSLEKADNDFERFFRYIALALEAVEPEVMETPFGILLGAPTPEKEAVLTAFINLANDLDGHTALILEDYQLIEKSDIHEALTFLLDHLPSNFHFILTSRGQPPLPLARYRARGELLEVGINDLQFRPHETESLLNESSRIELSAQNIESLQNQLEGWVAGLQLVTLALERGLMKSERPEVTGQQRFVVDYLQYEVMTDLPQGMYDFLLRTSILERLCGPLCETVTEMEGGQAMLESLERERLFLLPLDDRREWFRYHSLFADFLAKELHRHYGSQVAALHRRAAHWFTMQGMDEPALQHAVAGHDGPTVAQIAENRFEIMLYSGQLRKLRKWLDALPEPWFWQYPVIGLVQAQLLGLVGNLSACMESLEKIEEAILQSERNDASWQLARVNTIRCRIACSMHDLDRAEPLAEIALQNLPAKDYHYRASVHFVLGEAYREVGRWQEAEAQYRQALSLVHDTAFRLMSAHIFGALADMALSLGQLHEAANYWDESLGVIGRRELWGYLPLPLTGWVYIRRAELQYEWNGLEKAADLVDRGLKRAELGGAVEALVVGHLVRARLLLARGTAEPAKTSLDQAQPYLKEVRFQNWRGRFDRLQVEVWLAQNHLRTAVNWSDAIFQDEALVDQPYNELTYLAAARVLIVKGDNPALQKALDLLRRLTKTAEAEGRTAVQIEALVFQALAYQKRGDEPRAMTAFEHALRLAEPEGYLRLFVDLGQEMARLLQTARARRVIPDYVAQLLEAFSEDWLMVEEQPLPEPLTEREFEILRLVSAGLTNREIAQQLVISAETVKKHAGNIYSKLGVSSRTEAAARARELDLID